MIYFENRQLPVTETNACHSKGLNECSDFDGTKDLDSYDLKVIEGTMEEIIDKR